MAMAARDYQASTTATEALRTTKIKSNPPALGLFSRSSPSDTFKPIPSRPIYEMISSGGPRALFEFSCQLCRDEWHKRHYSRRRHASSRGHPISSIDAHGTRTARAENPSDGGFRDHDHHT